MGVFPQEGTPASSSSLPKDGTPASSSSFKSNASGFQMLHTNSVELTWGDDWRTASGNGFKTDRSTSAGSDECVPAPAQPSPSYSLLSSPELGDTTIYEP